MAGSDRARGARGLLHCHRDLPGLDVRRLLHRPRLSRLPRTRRGGGPGATRRRKPGCPRGRMGSPAGGIEPIAGRGC